MRSRISPDTAPPGGATRVPAGRSNDTDGGSPRRDGTPRGPRTVPVGPLGAPSDVPVGSRSDPCRHQLDPDAVRILDERLAPADLGPDLSRAHPDLGALGLQFPDYPVHVIALEGQVIELLAVHVGGAEPTAGVVPVELEELGRSRASQRRDPPLRR